MAHEGGWDFNLVLYEDAAAYGADAGHRSVEDSPSIEQ